MDTRPIGVFDSGMGGLTCVRQMIRLLPGEDIGEELKQVLANWLFRHIRSEDKAYSETVLRHMAAAEARPAGD